MSFPPSPVLCRCNVFAINLIFSNESMGKLFVSCLQRNNREHEKETLCNIYIHSFFMPFSLRMIFSDTYEFVYLYALDYFWDIAAICSIYNKKHLFYFAFFTFQVIYSVLLLIRNIEYCILSPFFP